MNVSYVAAAASVLFMIFLLVWTEPQHTKPLNQCTKEQINERDTAQHQRP